MANQPVAWQRLDGFRHVDVLERDPLKFKPSVRNGGWGAKKAAECGMAVGGRRAGLLI